MHSNRTERDLLETAEDIRSRMVKAHFAAANLMEKNGRDPEAISRQIDLARRVEAELKVQVVGDGKGSSFVFCGLNTPSDQIACISLPSTICLSLLLPHERSEDVIANLEELFEVWRERHGLSWARWLFRIHTVGMILHHWLWQAKKLLF